MLRGALHLLSHSLAFEARERGAHVRRMLLGTLLFFVVWTGSHGRSSSAIGLGIFQVQMFFTVVALSLDAIYGYSTMLAEERKAGLLELLQLTNITPFGIVAGKAAGKLWQNSLLILVQFPFTLLCITLGGLTWPQVAAAYLALLAYSWVLSGVGAFSAANCLSTGETATQIGLFVFLYGVLPALFGPVSSGVLANVSVTARVSETLSPVFAGGVWSPSIWLALAGGALGHWLASRLVPTILREDSKPEFVNDVSDVSRKQLPALQREQPPGKLLDGTPFPRGDFAPPGMRRERPWDRPVAWWAFQQISDRGGGFVFRVFPNLALLLVATAGGAPTSLFISALVTLLDFTLLAMRLFRHEFQEQTWDSLLLTGIPVEQIYWDKLRGWMSCGWTSVFFPAGFGIVAIAQAAGNGNPEFAILLFFLVLEYACLYFAYFHFLAGLSLRHGWSIVPFALTGMLVAMWLLGLANAFVMMLGFPAMLGFSVLFAFVGLIAANVSRVLLLEKLRDD